MALDLVKAGQQPTSADQALRNAFVSLVPGAKVGPSVPALAQQLAQEKDAQVNAEGLPVPQNLGRWDALDQVLARHVTPAVLPAPDFAFSPTERRPIERRGDFWSGLEEGLKDTLPGMVVEWYRHRNAIETAMGDIQPQEGYDPFADKQIEDAGMRDRMRFFSDSQSPQETALRIRQHEERAANSAALEYRSDSARVGAVVGGFLDPTLFIAPEVLLPIKAAPRLVWGSLWEGTKIAGLNAGLSLGIEAAKNELDQSYDTGSIMDAIELPALIGFGVGTIRGAMARVDRRFGTAPSKDGVLASAPDDFVDDVRPPPVMGPSVGPEARARGMWGYEHSPEDAWRDRASFRDASSASVIRPGMASQQMADLLEREGLVGTGTGIERVGINPVLRTLRSQSLRARQLVTELVDLGGLKQNKNRADATGFAQPTTVPVEADIARVWRTKLVNSLSEMQAAWIEGRTGTAATMGKAATEALKLQARDFLKKDGLLTWGQFDERVARALRRGDRDAIQDAMTPAVEKAAAAARRYFNELKEAAEDPNVDLFKKTNQKTIDRLTKELAALKARGVSQVEIDAISNRLGQALSNLGKGPEVKGAQSYFTRLWNVNELTKRESEFVSRVTTHFLLKGNGQYTTEQAREIARNIHTTLTKSRFKTFAEESDDWLSGVGDPMSAMSRTFDIPDLDVEDFLESSAVLALRHQMANFVPTVELTRRFGDASLEKQLKAVEAEYKALHDAATTTGERTAINRQMASDLDDLQALRDRLLNVAGASKDPHSWDQRTIRMLKHYMVWTTMGLSAFSQLGDLFRPAITEGLDAVNRHGFGTLIDGSRKTIMEMAKKERLLSGDALEVVLASKSLAFSDIGDVFASRSNMERLANKTTTMFYMLNGMNFATDLTKDWASVIIQGNFNSAIADWGRAIRAGRGVDEGLTSRLRSLGIDGNDAVRIGAMLEQHGIAFKSVRMANTEAWTDTGAQELYRQALQRAIQRTVVTPGAGDRPIWMTTPIGSLITQFRTFGMSSMIRTLYAGLQDRDRQFWTGAAVLVGAGIVLNEVRRQLFYEKSSLDQPFLGVLADGLDRSGVLGSLMDANNALEAVSNNKLGLRPAMAAAKPWPVTPDRVANAFFGPSAGKAAEAANQLGRLVQGDFTATTWRRMRGFVPGQNLPYVDPLADRVFPSPSN